MAGPAPAAPESPAIPAPLAPAIPGPAGTGDAAASSNGIRPGLSQTPGAIKARAWRAARTAAPAARGAPVRTGWVFPDVAPTYEPRLHLAQVRAMLQAGWRDGVQQERARHGFFVAQLQAINAQRERALLDSQEELTRTKHQLNPDPNPS